MILKTLVAARAITSNKIAVSTNVSSFERIERNFCAMTTLFFRLFYTCLFFFFGA